MLLPTGGADRAGGISRVRCAGARDREQLLARSASTTDASYALESALFFQMGRKPGKQTHQELQRPFLASSVTFAVTLLSPLFPVSRRDALPGLPLPRMPPCGCITSQSRTGPPSSPPTDHVPQRGSPWELASSGVYRVSARRGCVFHGTPPPSEECLY